MYKNVLIVGNSIPKLTKTEYLNYFGVFNVFIYLSCVLSLFGGYLYYVKKIKVGDLRENSEFSKKAQMKQKKLFIARNCSLFGKYNYSRK